MTDIFITSDLHIAHKKCAYYRGFYDQEKYKYDYDTNKDIDICQYVDIDSYHNKLISNWNCKVSNDDIVYILGDVALTKNIDKISEVISEFNYRELHLIVGNHDRQNLKKQKFRDLFTSILEYYELNFNKTKYCLFHYPIEFWNKMHYQSVNLHGHLHSENPIRDNDKRQMDVGLDGNELYPWNIGEIHNIMNNIETKNSNHHD